MQNFGSEIWKPVFGFEKRFEISNHGRLRSINGRHKGVKILNPAIGHGGYYCTSLRMKPQNRKVRIHTLVAENFLIKPIGQWIVVNHKDGNKLNNHINNLEWCEASENISHAVRIGLMDFKGSNHHNSKLTEEDILKIRSLYPKYLQREIAAMFGICRRQAGDIINRVNWKHV